MTDTSNPSPPAFDPEQVKLGKLYVREDRRTLLAENYMAALPPPPAAYDGLSKVPAFGMFGNDRFGDCTFARHGHAIQAWTDDATGTEVTVADRDVLDAYAALTGFDPNTGANDNGAVLLDALNYQQKVGVGGHKTAAFAKLHPLNHDQVRQSIYLFDVVAGGVALPLTAQDDERAGAVWDVHPDAGARGNAGSWGGHAISFGGYNGVGPLFVTWGSVRQMTWAFFDAYVDEAYLVVSQDWLNQGRDPHGFDLATLLADVAAVTGTPPTPPPPSPTPPPSSTLLVGPLAADVVERIHRNALRRAQTDGEYVAKLVGRYFHLVEGIDPE